ncbi:MAG: four helix bundle protein [Gemmatimonadales bacterium]
MAKDDYTLPADRGQRPAAGVLAIAGSQAAAVSEVPHAAKETMSGMESAFARVDRMAYFKKLEVWRKAHALAMVANKVALTIRGSHYASFRSQIIRASMSIPANIVEGREQKTEPEFARFLRYSLSSTSELEYHLIAAHDIGVINTHDYVSLLTQVKQVRMMLFGLLKRLGASKAPNEPPKTVPL